MTRGIVWVKVLWILFPWVVEAHGLDAKVETSARAIVIGCAYSNGDRADAEVLVYSPHEATRIFQRLQTDLRGNASFVPDADGIWRVVVDDGMGHREELEVIVEDSTATAHGRGANTSLRSVVLAVLALAIAGWWMLRKRVNGT